MAEIVVFPKAVSGTSVALTFDNGLTASVLFYHENKIPRRDVVGFVATHD